MVQKKNETQGDGDDSHEDDLFDEHLPTRELAAMSIGSKPAKAVRGDAAPKAKKATATKAKAVATASMSFSERVKSRFGDTTTPAPTLAVREDKRRLKVEKKTEDKIREEWRRGETVR